MSAIGAVLELGSTEGLDDDGWVVCISAGFGEPAERVAAVLAGKASTSTLSEPVAVALLSRFQDPALVDPADLRTDVCEVVASFAPELDPTPAVDVADVAAALRLELATGGFCDPKNVLYRLGRAADASRRGVGEDVFVDAVLRCVEDPDAFVSLDLSRFVDVFVAASTLLTRADGVALRFAQRIPEMAPPARAAFTAALAVVRPRFAAEYSTLELLREAWRAAERAEVGADPAVTLADPTDALRTAKHLEAISEAFVSLGGQLFGPGSLAEMWGLPDDLAELDPQQAAELVSLAGARPAVGRFCEQWSDGGTQVRPIPGQLLPFAPNATQELMPWQVAVAVADTPTNPRDFADRVVSWAKHPDAEAVLAAICARDELRTVLLANLPNALRWKSEVPASLEPLVVESMNTIGLCEWVDCVAEVRRRLVAAAAGIGRARWEVVVSLLEDFHGTPSELVALTGPLAPVN